MSGWRRERPFSPAGHADGCDGGCAGAWALILSLRRPYPQLRRVSRPCMSALFWERCLADAPAPGPAPGWRGCALLFFFGGPPRVQAAVVPERGPCARRAWIVLAMLGRLLAA